LHRPAGVAHVQAVLDVAVQPTPPTTRSPPDRGRDDHLAAVPAIPLESAVDLLRRDAVLDQRQSRLPEGRASLQILALPPDAPGGQKDQSDQSRRAAPTRAAGSQ